MQFKLNDIIFAFSYKSYVIITDQSGLSDGKHTIGFHYSHIKDLNKSRLVTDIFREEEDADSHN